MLITQPPFVWHKRVLLVALLALPVGLAPRAAAGDGTQKVSTLDKGTITAKVTPALPPLTKVFAKVTPESLQELKEIESRVTSVVQKVMPAVVGVRVGAGQGSGVIISADGYVLTAAHVSGPAGRKVLLILPDGREVKGETLGANVKIDAGLIKIKDKGPWPFVAMGDSAALARGVWCIAIGHPNGYVKGRAPVVRLGRILDNLKPLIRTDCVLVGGDSGGPLFDLNGKVIGIHSRIGPLITFNIHVPVDYYRKDWDRMVNGEVFPQANGPYLGVQGDTEAKECRIVGIYPNSPAEKAGLQEGDVVVSFAGKKVQTFDELVELVSRQKIGTRVSLEVRRDGTPLTIEVTIGKRS